MAPEQFSPAVRAWFESTFRAPTTPQEQGWPAIARGDNALLIAPTGSGKTLAAFLAAIDRLGTEPEPPKQERCRVLYISPLRALAVDVDKNLRAPLRGIELAAERLGVPFQPLRVGMRTGDTDARERAALVRNPPDILITTPESLFLMLTSQAREILRSVRTVIVDEIHSLAPTKRGAHLALSLERLAAITAAPTQRIGLSATVRPVDEIARFLGGHSDDGKPRSVTIVDAGARKALEIEVIVPVDDMADVNRIRDELPTGPGASTGPLEENPPEGHSSIWPHIHPRLLELIRAHHTTLIFTNARRLAERLAARLNELAGEDLVRAHHGSLAREQRLQIEDDLKSGRLRALVATSSLELGIDMGTVDLVVLVESPGSVARGLQRVGRAGHQVGEPSTGKIFPKWRGDLLETAAVVERMLEGRVEEMRVPRNPLDVLAQQVVAACAMDEWDVDTLAASLRRASSFTELTDDLFHSVLDLLAGRYPSDQFAGLRPRIVWDRVEGRVRARDGAQRVAVTNAGTIPDRGLFGVFLPEGGRVGELDEEMVYESRPGEVIALGASAWRIEEITHDRVVVTPAPGEHAKLPFWKGDKPGRPLELGRGMGAMVRELRSLDESAAHERLTRLGFDTRATTNLLAYLDEQAEVGGAVPDDRTIVIERFPDEIGDWRVCILTPFGARVHAPWALAIEEKLERADLASPAMWSDDGIVLRLPEAIDNVPLEHLVPSPEEIDELVTARLPSTSLFAARFRENAARALLLPRRNPQSRTPLWQQRQRAADLLEVASQYPTFPILLETTREALRDVFDLPALREVLRDLQTRRVRAVPVETRHASPFAQSLLFSWIAVYMYEGDAPLAERRATALALDRDLLRELLGGEELRELLDPAVLEQLELELQHLAPERQVHGIDGLADLLVDVGDLSVEEAEARSRDTGVATLLELLVQQRRAVAVTIAGAARYAPAQDAARYRDALGCALPPGLPHAFTDPVDKPLDELVARYARTHAPFTDDECAQRLGAATARVVESLARLEAAGRVVHGEFRPGSSGGAREWCDEGVLRVLRRRSLAALRKEIEPVDAEAYARFLPAWHGIGRARRGIDALVDAVEQLQGAPIPASVLEREVLPARVSDYRPAMLDELCAAGGLVWVGAGALGSDDGRVRLCFRDQARLLLPTAARRGDPPAGALHEALRAHLAERGASFWIDLLAATHNAPQAEILGALWDLVWAGEVTNDTFGPVRAARHGTKRASKAAARKPELGRLSRLGPPAGAGRWSLVADLLQPGASPTEQAHALAGALLSRHGIVTREGVNAEGVSGGFTGVYPVLKALEESGRLRRGWFVAGLGAAQFALPGAVERLRGVRDTRPSSSEHDDATMLVLAATDPAQPYGAALAWPERAETRATSPARAAGAHVVLVDGAVVAYVERGGRSLSTFASDVDPARWADALVVAHKEGRVGALQLQTIDGQPARTGPLAPALRAAGFVDGYRGLTLRS
jgi:ATP-dependent Lhr-like helicase